MTNKIYDEHEGSLKGLYNLYAEEAIKSRTYSKSNKRWIYINWAISGPEQKIQ